MYKKFLLIYGLMNQADKRRLLLIVVLSLVNGVLGVAGIASIVPFIGLISEPELIETNEYLIAFSSYTGISEYSELVVAFAIISFILVLAGNVLSASDVWVSAKFGYFKERQLSGQLLTNYLQADDLEFAKQKQSERVKSVLADVDRVILDTLFAQIDMFASMVMASLIFILLLVVDYQATLIVSAAIIAVYLLVYQIASKRLDRLGKEFADIETDLYSDVLEALKLHREIKLARIQAFFVDRYSETFRDMITNRLKYELISLVPQRVIETIGYASILMIAIYFALEESLGASSLTLIGVYAFAMYRLMPAVEEIFDSFEQIQFGSAILRRLVKQLTKEQPTQIFEPIELKSSSVLKLANISFAYRSNQPLLLNNINLAFELEKFHCIMGKTGCGKSTLLNIICGFYRPNKGTITLDNQAIDLYENNAWQDQVGYVPAKVNLMDVSLAENIALGFDEQQIDNNRLQSLLELVELDSLVGSLKEGVSAIVGDNGLSFSSGQIQKIGLARALYRQPKLLILDESTDALDLASEKRILSKIKKEFQLTIIFVSHRPSVTEFADQIIDLEQTLVRD
ncbi:ABC transporter ATP-binding protein [Aliikangiella marina]|uniref:ABC transporter ATP-binding protein n=1 Tax=Aliikangiella marina TaxID=1712262 RepID=A0A545T190_9GAMM|nr:ABC transporter ATP-binding protein [Aliikangiella marina]TQV70987.1 ABC transporter ATP-binding protein [Aliikangiella marina]